MRQAFADGRDATLVAVEAAEAGSSGQPERPLLSYDDGWRAGYVAGRVDGMDDGRDAAARDADRIADIYEAAHRGDRSGDWLDGWATAIDVLRGVMSYGMDPEDEQDPGAPASKD